ncbi:uncharacterized protein LOC62_01G000230 [Vanrija pseudolonga]|uniref:Uncharacterized protein n=1 Tax=Vanrija pseudolonga TaxID=143232 RepID=A0AAF1BMD9_9TREE|nr:hypothetical protein LOC62_01G000230 [Vanrija pseudolonga]
MSSNAPTSTSVPTGETAKAGQTKGEATVTSGVPTQGDWTLPPRATGGAAEEGWSTGPPS